MNSFSPFTIFYFVAAIIAVIFLALILYFTYLLFFSWLAIKIINDFSPYFIERSSEIKEFLPK